MHCLSSSFYAVVPFWVSSTDSGMTIGTHSHVLVVSALGQEWLLEFLGAWRLASSCTHVVLRWSILWRRTATPASLTSFVLRNVSFGI
jgi:hypothetical protein